MTDYMSGDELYRYLHISKRKMKYLLENGYIPVTDTGLKTHRYRVKREDAKRFKHRMQREPGFLDELSGKFSNRPQKPIIEPTEENCRTFGEYLTKLWADYPDALTAKEAAELIGCTPPRINDWINTGKLRGTTVLGKHLCSKESLIARCSSSQQRVKQRALRSSWRNIRVSY